MLPRSKKEFLLVFGCLLVFGGFLKAQPISSSITIGKIMAIDQLVLVRRNLKGIPVDESGVALFRGDEVMTNETGKAQMLLSGGNEIFVAPSSNLFLTKHTLDRYQYGYDLTLQGKLRAKVPRVPMRRFRIKTSNAMIQVKGTDFIAEFKDGDTKIATLKGLVSLTSLTSNKTVDVEPGKMVFVSDSGELSKPAKIEKELIKGLEHAGKTGIKELDPETKEPETKEPEPIPVKNEEPEVDNPEDVRRDVRIGLGIATEIGNYSGSMVFADYNLGERYQIHVQSLSSKSRDSLSTETPSDGSMEKTTNSASMRFFLDNSGTYFGFGGGSGKFTQRFRGDSSEFTTDAAGVFALADIGGQIYYKTFGSALAVNFGVQLTYYLNFDDSDIQKKLSDQDQQEFRSFSKDTFMLILVGVVWYF